MQVLSDGSYHDDEFICCPAFANERIIIIAAPDSSDWLFALPVLSCGLRLDNEAVPQ